MWLAKIVIIISHEISQLYHREISQLYQALSFDHGTLILLAEENHVAEADCYANVRCRRLRSAKFYHGFN